MALGDDLAPATPQSVLSSAGVVAPAPAAAPAGQSFLDTLSGAFGAPVDRGALNAGVQAGQTRNGLISAQTALALMNAKKDQDEGVARQQIGPAVAAFTKNQALGDLVGAHALSGELGKVKDTMDAMNGANTYQAGATTLNPSNIGTPAGNAAAAFLDKRDPAAPVTVPGNFTNAAGAPQTRVSQTPEAAAQTSEYRSLAGLHDQQTAVGGYNPHAAGGGLGLPLDQQTALNKAINEGRLDPLKVNSRNAPILAQAEISQPGVNDYNRMHSTANLQANASFQQKGMVMDALPTMIQNMVTAGKKLNYPDLQVAGEAKKWLMGQSNDPDLAEYMGMRNDTLMNLASVMRGVGMSDKAHDAEIEANAPTLSPRALEGWARGQMTAIGPRLAQMHAVTDSRSTAAAPGAPPLAGAPAPVVNATPAADHIMTPAEYKAKHGIQ